MFAGSDFKRNAAKWRCPTGECEPKSKWVKAHRRYPLIPRETRTIADRALRLRLVDVLSGGRAGAGAEAVHLLAWPLGYVLT
jgi:hypothetical protein